MDKLIKFIDRNTFDDQLYWVVPQLYSGKEFEIQWRKSQDLPWRFRIKGTLFWKLSKSKDLIPALNQEKIDLLIFETYVRNSIMQQVVFANKLVDEGKQLFGEKKVSQAMEENDRFLDELKNAILELTNKKESDDAQVKETKALPKLVKSKPGASLKLVKSKLDT